MVDWQDISSAPKDGTEIDVWVRDFKIEEGGGLSSKDIGRRTNVWWGNQVETYFGPYERRESEEYGWVSQDECHVLFIETGGYRATHWMPLPPPPPTPKAP